MDIENIENLMDKIIEKYNQIIRTLREENDMLRAANEELLEIISACQEKLRNLGANNG